MTTAWRDQVLEFEGLDQVASSRSASGRRRRYRQLSPGLVDLARRLRRAPRRCGTRRSCSASSSASPGAGTRSACRPWRGAAGRSGRAMPDRRRRQRLVRLAGLHQLGARGAPRRGRRRRGRAASWSRAGWRHAPRRRPPRRSPSGPGTTASGLPFVERHDLAVIVRRHAAHVVMHGRQHRDRLLGHVDAGEDLRGLGDAGQALVQQLRVEVLEMQVDVVLLRADSRGPRGSPSSSSALTTSREARSLAYGA